jgi:hypothetical protein
LGQLNFFVSWVLATYRDTTLHVGSHVEVVELEGRALVTLVLSSLGRLALLVLLQRIFVRIYWLAFLSVGVLEQRFLRVLRSSSLSIIRIKSVLFFLEPSSVVFVLLVALIWIRTWRFLGKRVVSHAGRESLAFFQTVQWTENGTCIGIELLADWKIFPNYWCKSFKSCSDHINHVALSFSCGPIIVFFCLIKFLLVSLKHFNGYHKVPSLCLLFLLL